MNQDKATEKLAGVKYAGAAHAAHTPGPWILERDRAKSLSLYAGKQFIGEVWNEADESTPEQDANARLIAAAPDLLEALISLRKEIKSTVKFDVKKHYHLMVADVCADKAIRKATERE